MAIPNRFSFPQEFAISENLFFLYFVFEIIVITNVIIVDCWFFYSSYSIYRYLKNKNISPWLEKRYLIISIAILFSAISASLTLVIPPTGGSYAGSQLSWIIAIIKVPIIMVFYFGSLIGWIMPKFLKNYFDRNLKTSSEKEMTEEEIMKELKDE